MNEFSNKLGLNLDSNSHNKFKLKLNDNVTYKFLPTLGNAQYLHFSFKVRRNLHPYININ